MIKFNEIKIGDFVMGEYDGKLWQGEVTGLNGDEKQIGVQTDVQQFWFDEQHLQPLPLTEEQLLKLNFTKEVAEDGSVKFSKGAFRLVIKGQNDFSHIDMWYREDRRHNPDVHYVHQLQNHYAQMTKVHLTTEPM